MLQNISQKQIEGFFEANLARYLDVLRQMVSINSFTTRPDSVDLLGELTKDVFSELGFVAECVSPANPLYGHHLVLTKQGIDGLKSPTVGMVSHLDTVYPPEDELRNHFKWRIEGERAYGPGTVDIKGGTLMIYMVLEFLKSFVPDAFAGSNWLILMNSAEETLEPDFGELCRERLPEDALACLVFESGRQFSDHFSLVTARKGMATFRVVAEGKAAHAGSSHKRGANAIVQLAHTITQISELTDYDKGITFNVGIVDGGTVLNRVPHQAFASGELRAFSSEELERGISNLLSLQDGVQVFSLNGSYPCDVSVEILNRWLPWPSNNGSKHLLTIWQEAATLLEFKATGTKRGGLSDGNLLWDFVPTIDGLGPAGGNAHCSERSQDGSKDQEYVKISSFVPKATLNSLAILKLLGN